MLYCLSHKFSFIVLITKYNETYMNHAGVSVFLGDKRVQFSLGIRVNILNFDCTVTVVTQNSYILFTHTDSGYK